MKNPFQNLRFPEFKKARPTASAEDGQISLPLYEDPNQCELFPDNLEAWVRWIEGLDLTCLGYRPVQDSGRKVLLELCYCVGWDPDANADRYGEAWPSIELIAKKAFPGCKNARRKTFRILSRLEDAGFVERIERRRSDGGTATNLYRLEPAMRKKVEDQVKNGGVSISAQNDTGGVSISAQNDTGGVSISAQNDTQTKIEPKKEPHPAKTGRDFVNKSDSSKEEKRRAKAWLQKKSIFALKYAGVAVTDPEHWRRVQRAAKAHPDAGPGMIVSWLKNPDAVPEVIQQRLQPCPHGLAVSLAMFKDANDVQRCRHCSKCEDEMAAAGLVIHE